MSLLLHAVKSGLFGALTQRILWGVDVMNKLEVIGIDQKHLVFSWEKTIFYFLHMSTPFRTMSNVKNICASSPECCLLVPPQHVEVCDIKIVLEYYKTSFNTVLNKKVNGLFVSHDSSPYSIHKLAEGSPTIFPDSDHFDHLVTAILMTMRSNIFLSSVTVQGFRSISGLILKHIVSQQVGDCRLLEVVIEDFGFILNCVDKNHRELCEALADVIVLYFPCIPIPICRKVPTCQPLCILWSQALEFRCQKSHLEGPGVQVSIGDLAHSLACLLCLWPAISFSEDPSAVIVDLRLERCVKTLWTKAERVLHVNVLNETPDDLILKPWHLGNTERVDLPSHGNIMVTEQISKINPFMLHNISFLINMSGKYLNNDKDMLRVIWNAMLNSFRNIGKLNPCSSSTVAVCCALSSLTTYSNLGDQLEEDILPMQETAHVCASLWTTLLAPSFWQHCEIRYQIQNGTVFRNPSNVISAFGSFLCNIAISWSAECALKLLVQVLQLEEMPVHQFLISIFRGGLPKICQHYPAQQFLMRFLSVVASNLDVILTMQDILAENNMIPSIESPVKRARAESILDSFKNANLSSYFSERIPHVDEETIFVHFCLSRLQSLGTPAELDLFYLPHTSQEVENYCSFVESLHSNDSIRTTAFVHRDIMSSWVISTIQLAPAINCETASVARRSYDRGFYALKNKANLFATYAIESGLVTLPSENCVEVLSNRLGESVQSYGEEANGLRLVFQFILRLLCTSVDGVIDTPVFVQVHNIWAKFNTLRVIDLTWQLISAIDGGVIQQKLLAICVPARLLIKNIVNNWFLNWLPLCDILLITAKTITSDIDQMHHYAAGVTASIIVTISTHIGKEDELSGELFGAEVVMRTNFALFNPTCGKTSGLTLCCLEDTLSRFEHTLSHT